MVDRVLDEVGTGEMAGVSTLEPLVVLLHPGAAEDDVRRVVSAADEFNPGACVARGDGWAALAIGDGVRPIPLARFIDLEAVKRLVQVSAPYRLASREVFGRDLSIGIWAGAQGSTPAIEVGGSAPIALIVSSGWAMTSVSRLQLLAPMLAEAGCRVFHAGELHTIGAQWPASRAEALDSVREILHEHGLALCVEVSDPTEIDRAEGVADLIQVGSRNMQDFSLLRAMGRASKPVLLKRGYGSTVEEFLLAAEYVVSHGNGRVIICESGIRTFDSLSKPRFEINAVPLLRRSTHLPLFADPSQPASHAGVVPALARSAVAAGADGLVLEVGTESRHDPDGSAIDLETLRRLVAELKPIARAVGRSIVMNDARGEEVPRDAGEILRRTDRTLAQVLESLIGLPPDLEVVAQWRIASQTSSWLSPPLSAGSEILGRCTTYRTGGVLLSRHLSYVDLGRIDPTLAALLETTQVNLGQLFVDPKIEKLKFEFGTDEDAGEIDAVFRKWFPEDGELHPYVWRRYQASIRGVVTFVVIEALPSLTWEGLLEPRSVSVIGSGSA